MERKYKAFISYRHLPVDIDIAIRLHRLIERFNIPAKLRKNGEKKLGLVFRDQDELPLSSNLSDNIRTALDNSEYLIVICTPETPKSQWVLREISYFLEHHDREYVLAVLADGNPKEAFPSLLTDVCNADGVVIRQTEPLAANVVAESKVERRRLLKKESLRLMAALIGCAYDDLYKRQQRRKNRMAAIISSSIAVILSAFIGLLLEKNAQINEQLYVSQINESKVLASLAESEYQVGNYRGALEYALQALPFEGNSRPYVPQAEAALASVLGVYPKGDFGYVQSYQQETDICSLAVLEDGTHFITADNFGQLCFVNAESGDVIWKEDVGAIDISFDIKPLKNLELILVMLPSETKAYSIFDGKLIWQVDYRMSAISNDDYVGLCFENRYEHYLLLLDLRNGKPIQQCTFDFNVGYGYEKASAISASMSFCATVVEDYSGLPYLLLWNLKENTVSLCHISLSSWDVTTDLKLLFTEDDELLLACDQVLSGTTLVSYSSIEGLNEMFNIHIPPESASGLIRGTSFYLGGVQLLDVYGDKIYLCNLKNAFAFDADSGYLLWEADLPDLLIDAHAYENGSIALVMINGTVSLCTTDGLLAAEYEFSNFSTGFDLSFADFYGNSFDNSTFVLVSDAYPSRASIIRKQQIEDASVILKYEDNEATFLSGSFCSSPSGNLSAFTYYDYSDSQLDVKLIDSTANYAVTECTFVCDGNYWSDRSKMYLTEDGKLISRGSVLDLKDNRLTSLAPDGNLQSSYSDRFPSVVSDDRHIVTASIFETDPDTYTLMCWTDGFLTEQIVLPDNILGDDGICSADCVCVGGNKIAIVSLKHDYDSSAKFVACFIESGQWTPLDFSEQTMSQSFAMAQSHTYAAVSMDNSICVVDLLNGMLVPCETENLPMKALEHLMFAHDDKFVLMFFSSGDLAIFDAESGIQLSRLNFGELGIHFDDYSARYKTFHASSHDKLLIMFDSGSYSESLCIFLDLNTLESAGNYSGVISYISSKDAVLVKPYLESLYYCSFLSCAEIMDIAFSILG